MLSYKCEMNLPKPHKSQNFSHQDLPYSSSSLSNSGLQTLHSWYNFPQNSLTVISSPQSSPTLCPLIHHHVHSPLFSLSLSKKFSPGLHVSNEKVIFVNRCPTDAVLVSGASLYRSDWHAWYQIHSGFHKGSAMALASRVKDVTEVRDESSERICRASVQSEDVILRGSVTASMLDVAIKFKSHLRIWLNVEGAICQIFLFDGVEEVGVAQGF
jgi:hypothetical protein